MYNFKINRELGRKEINMRYIKLRVGDSVDLKYLPTYLLYVDN
jgi:hypothetical protein